MLEPFGSLVISVAETLYRVFVVETFPHTIERDIDDEYIRIDSGHRSENKIDLCET